MLSPPIAQNLLLPSHSAYMECLMMCPVLMYVSSLLDLPLTSRPDRCMHASGDEINIVCVKENR